MSAAELQNALDEASKRARELSVAECTAKVAECTAKHMEMLLKVREENDQWMKDQVAFGIKAGVAALALGAIAGAVTLFSRRGKS